MPPFYAARKIVVAILLCVIYIRPITNICWLGKLFIHRGFMDFRCRENFSNSVHAGKLTIPSNWAERLDGPIEITENDMRGGASEFSLVCGGDAYKLEKTTDSNGKSLIKIKGTNVQFDPSEKKIIHIGSGKKISVFTSDAEFKRQLGRQRRSETTETFEYYRLRAHLGLGLANLTDTTDPALPDTLPDYYKKKGIATTDPSTPDDSGYVISGGLDIFPNLFEPDGSKGKFANLPFFLSIDVNHFSGFSPEEDRMGYEGKEGELSATNVGLGVGISANRLYHIANPVKKGAGEYLTLDFYVKTDVIGVRDYTLHSALPGRAPAILTEDTELSHIANTPNVTLGMDLRIWEALGFNLWLQIMNFNDLSGPRDALDTSAVGLGFSVYPPERVTRSTNDLEYAKAKQTEVIEPVAPPAPPPPEPDAPPPPPPPETAEVPVRRDLKALQKISFTTHVEFKVREATPIPGPKGEGELNLLDDKVAAAILEHYKKNNLAMPEKGSTLVVEAEGHSSSEGEFKKNMPLSISRSKAIVYSMLQSIQTEHDNGAEPFAALKVDRDNFFSTGKGETAPIDKTGNIIEPPFGGYEAPGNFDRDSGIFYLCKGSNDPNIAKSKCAPENLVEEDVNASRRVEIDVQILPPGVKAPKRTMSQMSPEELAADKEAGMLLQNFIRQSAWMKGKQSRGIKYVRYNEIDNSFEIVLDITGYSNRDTLKTGLFKEVKNAEKKNISLSSICTIRFVLFDASQNPPPSYDENIRTSLLGDFRAWPFAGGIDVAYEAQAYDKKNLKAVEDALMKLRLDHQAAMFSEVKSKTYSLGGANVTILPISDFSKIPEAENEKLAQVATEHSGGKAAIYMDVESDVKDDVADYMGGFVRNIIDPKGSSYYLTRDNRIGNYIIILSADKEIELDKPEAEELRNLIYDKIKELENSGATPSGGPASVVLNR
jgi:hypothetical protein